MKMLTKFLVVAMLSTSTALAGPGAHGPNGEHLDAPGSQHAQVDTGPRIETFTESFELVGQVEADQFSIMIDRYETNEPVLGGKLEVEVNGAKASAKFHADHGDYVVNDVQFLKMIAAPGKHGLVFTLTAGDESDLLEGTLDVKAVDDVHSHSSGYTGWIVAGGLLAAVLIALAIRRVRRQSSNGN